MKKPVTGKINFCTLAGDRQNIHFVNKNRKSAGQEVKEKMTGRELLINGAIFDSV